LDALIENHARRKIRRFTSHLRRIAARAMRINRLFVWSVAVPTVASSLYFGLLAHDIYVSESQFVVRSVQRPMMTGLGSLLQGSGLAQAGNDVYSVQDFLISRDALSELEGKFQLKRSFGSSSVDWLNRYNASGFDDSFENFLRYYQKFVVETDLDSTSSILTLTVRAFSAEEAYRVNQHLLALSEAFVNKMNERARNDLVRFALSDVTNAQDQEKSAVLALAKYRNDKSLYDPDKQSGLQLQEIGALQQELVATEKLAADVVGVAKESPQIPVLQNRIKVLQGQISSEMAKVAGSRSSLSSKSPEYDSIVLDRDFAGKYLQVALDSLEQARQNAMSQQLYIERIEEPGKPDVAIEPRRIRNVIATLLLTFIVWGILSLLVTAVKEHSD
jgi:capsular polysaccharide transport system permease protein